jgi:hypothetical protein
VRWTATTEDEVRALISDGTFKESHHLDAKRETGTSPALAKRPLMTWPASPSTADNY